MLEIVIAFGVGALFGVGITCCLVMAGRTDREMGLLQMSVFKRSFAQLPYFMQKFYF